MEVACSSKGIALNQCKYVLDILEDFGFLGSKPLKFFMQQKLRLNKEDGFLLQDVSSYRSIISRLIYLIIARLDFGYLVQVLSQFMDKPQQPHLDVVHRILRYLKSIPGQGLLFPTNNTLHHLKAFTHSDWAGCPYSRRLITGYLIFLGDALISWKSKK